MPLLHHAHLCQLQRQIVMSNSRGGQYLYRQHTRLNLCHLQLSERPLSLNEKRIVLHGMYVFFRFYFGTHFIFCKRGHTCSILLFLYKPPCLIVRAMGLLGKTRKLWLLNKKYLFYFTQSLQVFFFLEYIFGNCRQFTLFIQLQLLSGFMIT